MLKPSKEKMSEEATVFVEVSFTVNRGNTNYIKVGGGMTVPVNASKELMNECMKTWKEGYDILVEKLSSEI